MTPTALLPLLPLAALATLSALAGTPSAGTPSARPTEAARGAEGRPVVLVVHGRGQLARDTTQLRLELRSALQRGTWDAAGDTLVGDDDVRLVWYADVLDPRSRRAPAAAGCVARAAGPGGDAGSAGTGAIQLIAVLAGALLDAVEPSGDDDDALELRGIAGDLRYFGDPQVRCAVEQRLDSALARAHREGRPVVLVAHSFGALVSWGHLRGRAAGGTRDAVVVQSLVTVGSPLASPEVRRLVFGDTTARLALPAGVRSWTNVVDTSDPLAARLSDSTRGPLPASMRDAFTETERTDPHDLRGYLRDPGTARAVTGAWCGAHDRRAPAGCATFATR